MDMGAEKSNSNLDPFDFLIHRFGSGSTDLDLDPHEFFFYLKKKYIKDYI